MWNKKFLVFLYSNGIDVDVFYESQISQKMRLRFSLVLTIVFFLQKIPRKPLSNGAENAPAHMSLLVCIF